LLIAPRTAASATGLTLRPPLSTRETVPRDTPASAATSSMVGRPFLAAHPVPPGCPFRTGRRSSWLGNVFPWQSPGVVIIQL
jgi:hypothetical protein